jgi:predicted amidohydrolase YtcJ
VFEEVNRESPFKGLNWFFDHCETVSDRNLERIKALGGGIAIQHRMAYQGEYFMDRYGKKAAERTPPMRKMLELGIPVGAGTDATRVASYNPWVSLYWMVTAKRSAASACILTTIVSVAKRHCVFTPKAAVGFPAKAARKARLPAGQLADFVALTDDYLSVPEEKSKASNQFSLLLAGRSFTRRMNLRRMRHRPSRAAGMVAGKSLRRLRCASGREKGRSVGCADSRTPSHR